MIALGLDIKSIEQRGGYSNATTPLNRYGHIYDTDSGTIADAIYNKAD